MFLSHVAAKRGTQKPQQKARWFSNFRGQTMLSKSGQTMHSPTLLWVKA